MSTISCTNSSTEQKIEDSTTTDSTDTVDSATIVDSATDSGDSGEIIDTADSGDTDIPITCDTDKEPAIPWFTSTTTEEWHGQIDFAQTHVIAENETRYAPSIIENRAMLVLFQPTSPIDIAEFEPNNSPKISAWRSSDPTEPIGTMYLSPPTHIPSILEQGLTSVPLEKWSDSAWSAFVPWEWVQEGVELRIGYEQHNIVYQKNTTLSNLASPHAFTISRAKIVLFGDNNIDTTTVDAQKLAYDFFSTIPFAQLHWVDSLPWYLPEIVVQASNGPVLVSTEEQRTQLTSDPDRWAILKNTFTIRMHMANVGLGLENTTFTGDNSPYSFGTSLGLGWVHNGSHYVDINNAPYSAGWTGWTAIWHGECGNVFNHEIGHSFTLSHFTTGSAASWGISDQYPNDGENTSEHPWGYDSNRNQFRTWYRVNEDGIVLQNDGSIQGKRDSMNGGEEANSITCFPQYTGYHAWKAQNWVNTTKTIQNDDIVKWDSTTHSYLSMPSSSYWRNPLVTDIPVMTIIGSIGILPESNHIYPPMFWDSGNTFALPIPNDTSVSFSNANYFLEILYTDGHTETALLNRPSVDTTDMYLFSVNLALNSQPSEIRLRHSSSAHPSMDIANSTVLYTRTISIPTELPQAFHVGQEFLANEKLHITELCEEGINCDTRFEQSTWRKALPISFHLNNQQATETTCSTLGEHSALQIPIVDTEGNTEILTLFGQRIVESRQGTTEQTWQVPLDDTTDWSANPHQEQSIRIWIPYTENQHIPSGSWTAVDTNTISVWTHDNTSTQLLQTIPLDIDVVIQQTELVDLENPYESDALLAPGSSLYYVLTDPTIGPTTREWWGNHDPTSLSIPMVDQSTGETTRMTVHAWKKTCNLGWGTLWSLNSGQVADETCTYQVRLEMPTTGNEHLTNGHTYLSPSSAPIIFEGRYWHGPVVNGLAGQFAYQLQYTAPL